MTETDSENRFQQFIKRVKLYISLGNVSEIARRYFILNSFDGILTILGLVIGSFIVGIGEPRIILVSGFGAAFALSLSGASSAFMVEKAERIKELKNLERVMIRDLNNSVHGKSINVISFLMALINGSGSFVSSITCLIPFYLSEIAIIEIQYAYYIAIGVILGLLFVLGALLGKISETNIVLNGVKMVVLGLVVAGLLMLLQT
ncbi:MAG: hypothetical protein ACTSSJ_01995 [Candidatus Odinarchaeia archaeon]